MKLLLDTHVFLWWDMRDRRLGSRTLRMLADSSHEVFVSAASVWEIAIKASLGKLTFSGSPSAAIGLNGFRDLAIESLDAEWAGTLEWDHTDPFDRMLVAQAERQSMTFVSADRLVLGYGRTPMLAATI